mmetsp:Transcript_9419/g.13744  ORF Transcript_9419/g.13744 Transcript_9419/m.13744 type:complete len:125 (-) Transcript_9419:267-641(-)
MPVPMALMIIQLLRAATQPLLKTIAVILTRLTRTEDRGIEDVYQLIKHVSELSLKPERLWTTWPKCLATADLEEMEPGERTCQGQRLAEPREHRMREPPQEAVAERITPPQSRGLRRGRRETFC